MEMRQSLLDELRKINVNPSDIDSVLKKSKCELKQSTGIGISFKERKQIHNNLKHTAYLIKEKIFPLFNRSNNPLLELIYSDAKCNEITGYLDQLGCEFAYCSEYQKGGKPEEEYLMPAYALRGLFRDATGKPHYPLIRRVLKAHGILKDKTNLASIRRTLQLSDVRIKKEIQKIEKAKTTKKPPRRNP